MFHLLIEPTVVGNVSISYKYIRLTLSSGIIISN